MSAQSEPERQFRARLGRAGSDAVTTPDGNDVPRWVREGPQGRAGLPALVTVGIGLAQNVVQVHGADTSGHAVLRTTLRREQVPAVLRRGDGSLRRCAFPGPPDRQAGPCGAADPDRLIAIAKPRPRNGSCCPAWWQGQAMSRGARVTVDFPDQADRGKLPPALVVAGRRMPGRERPPAVHVRSARPVLPGGDGALCHVGPGSQAAPGDCRGGLSVPPPRAPAPAGQTGWRPPAGSCRRRCSRGCAAAPCRGGQG